MNRLTPKIMTSILIVVLTLLSIPAEAIQVQANLNIKNITSPPRPLIIKEVTPLNGGMIVPFWLRNTTINPGFSAQGQISINIDNLTASQLSASQISVWNVNVQLLCPLNILPCFPVSCNIRVFMIKNGKVLNPIIRGFTGTPQCQNILSATVRF